MDYLVEAIQKDEYVGTNHKQGSTGESYNRARGEECQVLAMDRLLVEKI